MTHNANKIDIYVGGRVRARRQALGLSQEKLGSALGVTFQQVQKYEKGANRISASRLQQIAAVLGVPAAYFFEGLQDTSLQRLGGFAESDAPSYAVDTPTTDEGLQLMRAFLRISDPSVRKRIIELVETIASTPDSNAGS